MCGRFALAGSLNWLFRLLCLEPPPIFANRYNIAPTQPVFAFLYDIDRGRLGHDFLTWGLIPSFAKDPGQLSLLINARSETVAEKPAFKNAFRYRRCLMPASGFYEWKKSGERSQPWYFSAADDRQLCLAGIWEIWHGEGGEQVNSCAIITVPANSSVKSVHDRMPAIITPAAAHLWLNPETPATVLKELLKPASVDSIRCWQVSCAVNSTACDSEICIKPARPPSPFQPNLF